MNDIIIANYSINSVKRPWRSQSSLSDTLFCRLWGLLQPLWSFWNQIHRTSDRFNYQARNSSQCAFEKTWGAIFLQSFGWFVYDSCNSGPPRFESWSETLFKATHDSCRLLLYHKSVSIFDKSIVAGQLQHNRSHRGTHFSNAAHWANKGVLYERFGTFYQSNAALFKSLAESIGRLVVKIINSRPNSVQKRYWISKQITGSNKSKRIIFELLFVIAFKLGDHFCFISINVVNLKSINF